MGSPTDVVTIENPIQPTETSAGRLGLGRVVPWILGAALFAWAWLDPRFRDQEGFLDTAFCVPLAIGAALWLVSV